MTVFIVRDTEERCIQGVYDTFAAAKQEIHTRVAEMTDEPVDSAEWRYMREQYEILAMSVEGASA